MTTKKDPANIYQRLLEITADAGALEKKGHAPKQVGGFLYHRIDDVEELLRPLFVTHGVCPVVSVEAHETETVTAGSRSLYITRCRVSIEFVNADNPDERVSVTFSGDGFDYSDKGPGKAVSYATKTAYLAMFHLKGQPDNEEQPLEAQSVEMPKIDEAQSARLRDEFVAASVAAQSAEDLAELAAKIAAHKEELVLEHINECREAWKAAKAVIEEAA